MVRMDLEAITDALKGWLDKMLHVDWLSTAITIVVVLIVTSICAHLVTKLIKKMLHVDKNPLPASSIFVNIGRVTIWVIGVCVILSSCFDVNISAAITALGIGGLAISLGFQATLSNLIAGLQVSLTKLVIPGDHIRVGTDEGIVDDVTWRHTRIINARGEHIIIPNSLMNTDALVKLLPQSIIRISIIVTPDAGSMDAMISDMQSEVDQAVTRLVKMVDPAKIQLAEITERGYRGTLSFSVTEGADIGEVKTAALKAISDRAHGTSHARSHHTHRFKHVRAPKGFIDALKERLATTERGDAQ